MQWHDWNDEAFERARERNCPVLLFLRASWCRWCRELEEHTLADPRVVQLLTERFVGIQVDKDRRPDIDARYRRGGWPTLAWLDSEGELLTGANYLEPDELIARLDLIAERYPEHKAEIAAGVARDFESTTLASEEGEGPLPAQSTDELSSDLVEEVLDTLAKTSDPVHGGWGTRHKFPHPEALHFATVRWSQTGDPDTLNLVLRTLRHMQEGEIYDAVEGGFYRYATRADWSGPHHEKMLDANAKRLMAYVEAYQALGDESFKKTAEGILNWMHETLLDLNTQAFRGSQDADSEYAHKKTREARERHGAPDCDPTIFTNWNAHAVISLLKASVVLDEDRYRVQALATLDFLMDNLWDARAGMYHYWDGTYNLPGLLTDQAATLRALIEAMHYAGENRYLEPAVQLARKTIEHLGADDGSFFDTRYDPKARGGLRERESSILDNAAMAEALLRLGHMTRNEDFGARGRAVLQAFAGDYKRYGHFIAGYGRAVDLILHEPVHVTIVGPNGADRTRALRKAALQPYVANRIVQSIDPETDAELLEHIGLPVPDPEIVARAYVHQGRESYAETSKPERLPALMSRAERSN
ncbi:MAG: thioredoxin domain-containing protein [bacterium]|nr:thioredoxin domain-containing protein [bacterium]